MDSDNIPIDAKLLRSRLVNYKNPSYLNDIAWLEYTVELKNNTRCSINLCGNDAYLILKSEKQGFIDSLYVVWGKRNFLPQERDTIRVIDFFIDRPQGFSEINWLNPDQIIFNCIQEFDKSKIRDSVIYISSFKIKKGANFYFKIE